MKANRHLSSRRQKIKIIIHARAYNCLWLCWLSESTCVFANALLKSCGHYREVQNLQLKASYITKFKNKPKTLVPSHWFSNGSSLYLLTFTMQYMTCLLCTCDMAYNTLIIAIYNKLQSVIGKKPDVCNKWSEGMWH